MDTREREKSRETRALLRDSRFMTTRGRTRSYGGYPKDSTCCRNFVGQVRGLEECSAEHSLVSSLERLHSLPKRVTLGTRTGTPTLLAHFMRAI